MPEMTLSVNDKSSQDIGKKRTEIFFLFEFNCSYLIKYHRKLCIHQSESH